MVSDVSKRAGKQREDGSGERRTIKEDTSVEMRGKSFSSRQLPDSDLCYQGGHLGDALTLGAGINVPDFYVCCIFPCREESLE